MSSAKRLIEQPEDGPLPKRQEVDTVMYPKAIDEKLSLSSSPEVNCPRVKSLILKLVNDPVISASVMRHYKDWEQTALESTYRCLLKQFKDF